MASAEAPRLVAGLVERPRLFDLLDRGTQGAVTLVAAPAGSGKTMLVSSWLRSDPPAAATAWVSVERDETDATRFWGTVMDAVRASGALDADDSLTTLVPGSQPEFLRRLREGLIGVWPASEADKAYADGERYGEAVSSLYAADTSARSTPR